MVTLKNIFSVFALFLLLTLSLALIQAQSSQEENIEKYAGLAGTYLLKFQEMFMSVLSSLSFGVFGEDDASPLVQFQQFLLMAIVFIIVYAMMSFISLIPEGLFFPFSLAVTILAFLFIDVGNVATMVSNYESIGIIITVILPVLILLAFSFRMYNRAYNGKGKMSPFFAEVFNFLFLVFFGFFFLKYAGSEEGTISAMRVLSGWLLIIIGVTQTVLYKILAGLLHRWKGDAEKMKREIKQAKEMAKEELEKVKAEANQR